MTLDQRTRLGSAEPGTTIAGRSITIGEWHVATFAGLTGDYIPLHTDEHYAAATPFGGRIAHGLLTLVVGAGFIASEVLHTEVLGALGFDEIRFRAPVRLGDTIAPTARVRSVEDKAGGKRVVTLDLDVRNTEGTTVVDASFTVLVRRTAAGGPVNSPAPHPTEVDR